MSVFNVSIPQINDASTKIGTAQNNLKLTRQTIQEGVEQARSAWVCDTADKFFGDLSKLLQLVDNSINTFAGNVKATLETAGGNYVSNEEKEVDIVTQIHNAYS